MGIAQKQALTALGVQLHEEGLTWGSSGNLSVRTDTGVIVTASGSRLPVLLPEDLLTLDLQGQLLQGAPFRKPSKEASMHLSVYRRHSNAVAVIHASPPFSTYLACTDLELPANCFPEGMMQLKDVVRVPYRHAGSEELAAAVAEACEAASVLVLENHGVLVWAESIDDALLKLQVLEFAARLAHLERSAGTPLRQLSEEVVKDFRSSGYRR